MMVQDRKAPAYQEYAATMLANRHYRLMSLAERGLLYAMRLECWENKDLPASYSELAKYLGVNESEVSYAFTDRVKAFFKIDGNKLTCPELDSYRQHLNDRKAKQSEGGKKGAAKTNSKFKGSSNPQVPRQDRRESLVKHSIDQLSKTQSLENGHLSESNNDEWLNEYDKASNGN
jgi:uncharacterized protein YdaU (DUF1376 family)